MPQPTILSLLMQHFTLGLLLSIKDALIAGAERAHIATPPKLKGLVASYVGQQRYYHMNDAFHRALEENGASPTPPGSSPIITGRAGIFIITRLNATARADASARAKRSKTRRLLAEVNAVIGRLEQPDIFAPSAAPCQATVFFISVFNNWQSVHPERIFIAVPDSRIDNWLFFEDLDTFIQRYTQQREQQPDLAKPRIKRSVAARQRNSGTSP